MLRHVIALLGGRHYSKYFGFIRQWKLPVCQIPVLAQPSRPADLALPCGCPHRHPHLTLFGSMRHANNLPEASVKAHSPLPSDTSQPFARNCVYQGQHLPRFVTAARFKRIRVFPSSTRQRILLTQKRDDLTDWWYVSSAQYILWTILGVCDKYWIREAHLP